MATRITNMQLELNWNKEEENNQSIKESSAYFV